MTPANAIRPAVYQDIRCPGCRRWLCAIEGGISQERHVRVNCTNCKREYILPFPPADDIVLSRRRANPP